MTSSCCHASIYDYDASVGIAVCCDCHEPCSVVDTCPTCEGNGGMSVDCGDRDEWADCPTCKGMGYITLEAQHD
jgi:DnaJ-class molecular chaperone